MSDPSAQQQGYLGVAIAFFSIAVGLGLALHSWAVALPIAVLAVAFFVLSRRPPPESDDGAPRDET